MRVLLLPLFAIVVGGATDGETESNSSLREQYEAAAQAVKLRDAQAEAGRIEQALRAIRGREDCRDRISKARELFGKSPLLNREPASPDKPYLIYAVDRRQDGCSVMVMKGDPDDIRPLPLPSDRPILMIPAESVEE